MYTNDGDQWHKCVDWDLEQTTYDIQWVDEKEPELPAIDDLKNKWILKKYTEGS